MQCRKRFLALSSAAALCAASTVRAEAPAAGAAIGPLLEEAAAASPELAQLRAEALAQRARIPQAGALPDPSLTLGIQNDGFNRIAIGQAETSFLNIMYTQPLPWPGKRSLREQVASFGVREVEARLGRALLALEARVRRAFLLLQLSRGQLALLAEQEQLWTQAEATARSRYESGQAPQADLLRAQLERARLLPRRWAAEAEVATQEAELNRLRAHPLEEPIAAAGTLAEEPDPVVPTEEAALGDAEERSPELLVARITIEQAGHRTLLAEKERRPDFAINAALMPRGSLPPMWSLNVSVGLPLFSGSKQERAVEESEQRQRSEERGAEVVRQLLRLRTRERLIALQVLGRVSEQYRRQTLVLSAAAAQSTLAQYGVGRVPFAAVLEALSGHLADRAGYLATKADAQLVAIAQRELSLGPLPALGTAMSSAPMPSGGSARGGAAPAPARADDAPAGAPERAPGMNGM